VKIGGLGLSIEEMTRKLKDLNGTMALSVAGKMGATILPADQIKTAQANLQLLQSQLQALPPAAFQMSNAFKQAFGQMAAVIGLTASEEERGALIGAASNNMRVQAFQAYLTAMGAAAPLELAHQQRLALINLAIADQAQKQLALNQATFDYNLAQMNLAMQIGATIDPLEQYRQKLEQINLALAANPQLADRVASAQRNAALAMAQSYNSAAGEVASALAQAWPKNKAFAQAVAITSGLAGAIRVYSELPFWLAVPASATILAASIANAARIGSTSMESPSVSSGGGGSSNAPTSAPQQLMVQGIDPSKQYSGEVVRNLAEALIQFQKDGGQVVLQ
jgi:hypothetical protein